MRTLIWDSMDATRLRVASAMTRVQAQHQWGPNKSQYGWDTSASSTHWVLNTSWTRIIVKFILEHSGYVLEVDSIWDLYACLFCRRITKAHIPARRRKRLNCSAQFAAWKGSNKIHQKIVLHITIHHLTIWKMPRLSSIIIFLVPPWCMSYKLEVISELFTFCRGLLRSFFLLFRLAMNVLRLVILFLFSMGNLLDFLQNWCYHTLNCR